MTLWPSTRARQVYKALIRIGWQPVSKRGSHVKLHHDEIKYQDYIWAFHDNEEIGPRMLARIAKHTGLRPGDL